MSNNSVIIIDGEAVNETAEIELTKGMWSPIPSRYIGIMYAETIMLPIRQVKPVLPVGKISLNRMRCVKAIVNEEITYEVNEAEYRAALLDQDNNSEAALTMIMMSNNTVRTTHSMDVDDIFEVHSCTVEEAE